MQRENNSEITFLVEDLEAVLDMNRLLEKENQELKQELGRLKAQIASLKANDIERKSILWKKIQHPSNGKKDDTHQKQVQTSEQNPTLEKLQKKPDPAVVTTPPAMQFVSPNSATPTPKKLGEQNQSPKGPPPLPPPLPSKSFVGSQTPVRRMPEVIEFYRYLNKRNSQMESRTNVTGTINGNPRNMIGEIENRSTYLTAVKLDVETQQEFILFLIRKVETASFTEILALDSFVKWLDRELSCLVDERAVLKHFPQWPERKADALREAACSYRDLKNLESEMLSYKDNPKQALSQTLRQIQCLQDRLEQITNNIERTREGTCKRYKELQIPWDWMLDTGLVGQIKFSSLRLCREYLKRIVKELKGSKCSKVEDIMLQGARFAYRVHQFAGGFDLDTKQLFEELKQIQYILPHCYKLIKLLLTYDLMSNSVINNAG